MKKDLLRYIWEAKYSKGVLMLQELGNCIGFLL